MYEGIRSACCNHYENKVILSVSNMNLLILDVSTRRSSSAMYMRNRNTSQERVVVMLKMHRIINEDKNGLANEWVIRKLNRVLMS